jgi:RNA polymerase sigma-70 factor (ECF subfamily)
MDGRETERDEVSAALEERVRRFADLLRYARRRHGLDPQDLDELVQEVRLRLWRAQGSGESITAVTSSYMYRTAMSAAVDLIRKRRRQRRDAQDPDGHVGAAVADPSAGRVGETQEVRDAMRRALDSLAGPRAVAVRLHLAGYAREEIAASLGWSEAKTRNLVYRGLADLRARLTELGVGPEGGT